MREQGDRNAALLAAFLGAHPEITAREVAKGHWLLLLPGEVRRLLPVDLRIGQRDWRMTAFLVRGPRGGSLPLYRTLLRRNAATARVRLALDADDDVVAVVRLPVESLTEEELETCLGELYSLSEGAFEGLVHLAYPGVFPPMRRPGTVSRGSGPVTPGEAGATRR